MVEPGGQKEEPKELPQTEKLKQALKDIPGVGEVTISEGIPAKDVMRPPEFETQQDFEEALNRHISGG